MSKPLADVTDASASPLVFTELVSFYRDTPPLGPPSWWTDLLIFLSAEGNWSPWPPGQPFPKIPKLDIQIPPAHRPAGDTKDTVNPKGIAYSQVAKRLIVSLVSNKLGLVARSGGGPKVNGCLKEVNILNKDRRLWGPPELNLFGDENKLAVVPDGAPHFTPGDVYVSTSGSSNPAHVGRGHQIAKISADGSTPVQVWCELPSGHDGDGNPVDEKGIRGLAFDDEGAFDGDLIALTRSGFLYRINHHKHHTLIKNLNHIADLPLPEGTAVTASTFGPHKHQIAVGIEGRNNINGGQIYLIDKTGVHRLLADIYSATESIVVVPKMGGTLYVTQLDFHAEGSNRILVATSSQFLARLGQLIVLNEMSAEFWAIYWDGGKRKYFQSLIGRVTDRWTSEGLLVGDEGERDGENSELEQMNFAALAPVPPSWHMGHEIPGNFRTGLVAIATSHASVFVVGVASGAGFDAGDVCVAKYDRDSKTWTSWVTLNFTLVHRA